MFTGIITAIGRLEAITDTGDRRLRISCDWDCAAIDLGASIACSGICLTVIDRQDHWFEVAASAETMAVTTLGNWQQGNRINLERALCLGDELGGHIVSGHVDGLAVITSITPAGDSHVVWLEAPQALAKFVAPKGSVALDGVSLTVNAVKGNAFSLNIIQHSWEVTGWGQAVVGQKMNMEIDMLARYVARLAAFDKD
ncbi:riboflavin synthase [Candidatus Ponderosibacter sp. Uisw_141_02]|jgi:riboflavin synthase|uniref:riboflavin synthase n=1 Tax=Candidatus Ponderosibacter sp. Uisw_141_02 TaxID=3231000 RepID=UPI003D582ECA